MKQSSTDYATNSSNLLSNLIKGLIISLIITFVGVIILGFVMKWGNYQSNIITPVNLAIKGVSVAVGTFVYSMHANKGVFRGIIFGAAYTTLAFLVFSLLSGSFLLETGILLDYAFAIVAGVVAAIIAGIVTK